MLEFNSFIAEMVLIVVPLCGKKFTWLCSDGKSRSRLDNFWLLDGLFTTWKISGQWVEDRDILGHCPIWLLLFSKDWGPKPFRVFNGWLEHPDFLDFVAQLLSGELKVVGKRGFRLKENLKLSKANLKMWNKEVFGCLDLNI